MHTSFARTTCRVARRRTMLEDPAMTNRPAVSRPARRKGLRATASILIAALASGCTWGGLGARPDPPKITAAPRSTPLELDQRVEGSVDCNGGECMRRYELWIEQRGELSIRVDPRLEQRGEVVRVLLEDPVGNVIGRESTNEPGRSIELGGPAQPGRYTLLIHSASGSASYELLATLDTRGAPQTTRLEAAVAQTKQPPPHAPARGTSVAPSIPPASSSGAGKRGASFASNPKIDLGRYRTYVFARDPQQLLKSQPGAYIGNPFIDREIERAIRYELGHRSYELGSPDDAQFLVNFHTGRSSMAFYVWGGAVHNYAYANSYGSWATYPGYFGGVARSEIHTEGTLVIDVIDLATTELVWHGWTTKTTGWKDNEVVIKEAVAEILDQFPGS